MVLINYFKMRQIFFFLLFSCFSLSSSSQPKICERTLVFIPQRHVYTSLKISDSERKKLDQTLKSQFEILNFMANKGSDVPVFVESLYQEMTMPRGIRSPEAIEWTLTLEKMMKEKKQLEDLTIKEKETLVSVSGAVSALLLDYVKSLRKTLTDKAEEASFQKRTEEYWQTHQDIKTNDNEAMDLFFREREKIALNRIISSFNFNPYQKEAILIFGGGHNFPKYEDLIPGLCIKIPDQFKSEFKNINYSVNVDGVIPLKLLVNTSVPEPKKQELKGNQ